MLEACDKETRRYGDDGRRRKTTEDDGGCPSLSNVVSLSCNRMLSFHHQHQQRSTTITTITTIASPTPPTLKRNNGCPPLHPVRLGCTCLERASVVEAAEELEEGEEELVVGHDIGHPTRLAAAVQKKGDTWYASTVRVMVVSVLGVNGEECHVLVCM